MFALANNKFSHHLLSSDFGGIHILIGSSPVDILPIINNNIKVGKILPRLKKGDPMIESTFSKILNIVFLQPLNSYLEQYNYIIYIIH